MQLPQLTFTRFVAALIVLIFHGARGSYPFTVYPGRYLIEYGSVAVVYFFILSGFILTITYQAALERAGTINKRNFWVARLARIYPLYAFALLITILVQAVVYGIPTNPAEVLASGTLMQSWFPALATTLNGPGWSLSVETLFYALFPFLLLWLTARSSRTLLGGLLMIWVGGVGLFYGLINGVDTGTASTETYHNLINYSPWVHLPTFINGCICGLIFWRYMKQPVPATTRNRLGWVMLFAGTAGMIAVVQSQQLMTYAQGGILSPIFALFILGLAVQTNTVLTHLLSWQPLVYLGEISYGLYILQMPVVQLLKKVDLLALGNSIWRDLFTFAALFIITVICYHVIERPAQAFIRRQWSVRPIRSRSQNPV